ncbi:ferritin-like domain-containing protein [Paracoccus suum]|uniref:Ferritin-like domain-containing protein n=1 Tax=Paracoccus suum TaxID=2259340 RepID=A0A344PLP9_9RHOB|nr:ferritin-like domain-containing protein [Paracoccus suum]AXC50304.1 ferritin-like domain-containing protein [Paracoccus suum]
MADKKSTASEDKTLIDLLEHGLKDIYYAENRIYKALPKMIDAAKDEALIEGLTNHREETAGHIKRLEEAFAAMDKKAVAQTCDAMDGILKEGESLLKDFGGTEAGDAAIIFSCQAVEHYEITRYGSLVAYADLLGLDEVADLLQANLDEEEAADEALTDVAESSANPAAAGEKAKAGKKK